MVIISILYHFFLFNFSMLLIMDHDPLVSLSEKGSQLGNWQLRAGVPVSAVGLYILVPPNRARNVAASWVSLFGFIMMAFFFYL